MKKKYEKLQPYASAELQAKPLAKILGFFTKILPFIMSACTQQNTPSLPDLERSSIPYDSTVQKANQLKDRIKQLSKT